MTRSLNRIFFIQITLFSLSIFIVSMITISAITIKSVDRNIVQAFHSELQIYANQLNYKVLIAEENVKAVSSRSMIKTMLFEYSQGRLTLKQIRDYTQQKFTEGVSVYSDLIYAVRTDNEGILIADYHPENRRTESEQEGSLYFFKTESGCNIVVRNPIIHELIHIGTDEAAFYLGNFSDIKSEILEGICVKSEYIADAELKSYSGSVPIGETGYFLSAELNQGALRKALFSEVKPMLFETAIMLLIVFLISYFTILRLALSLNNRLNESNIKLNRALQEKETLFRELQHRIKNNLSFITSYIRLRKLKMSNKADILETEQLINKIEAMSIAYSMLLEDEQEVSSIELGTYLMKLCRTTIETSYVTGIKTKFQCPEKISIDSKTGITTGLLFSELVINSIKHAKRETDLTISIKIEKEADEIILYYEDDGKPYPGDLNIERSDSFGMMIISSLVKQINAEMEYDFKRSKLIKISLPVTSES